MPSFSEFLAPMWHGTEMLLDVQMLLLILVGVVFGVIVGAVPGTGQVLAFAVALPFTFAMSPAEAVAFLMALSVALMYGNSIPAILLAVPGTPAAMLTAMDGYALHRRGQGGLALGISLASALFGQLISIPFFVLMVVPLSGLAYIFLAPELFSLYFFGMIAIVSLTGKNLLKGLAAAGFGMSLAFIGLDPVNSSARFVFAPELRSGLNGVVVVIGLLAMSELFRQTRQVFQFPRRSSHEVRFPALRQLRRIVSPTIVGTIVGTLVGAIPGTGSTAGALISYQQAQAMSKTPDEFGRGSVEGIAANEAAQNASNAGELIPTLGLGIPASSSMVLLLAALQLQGMVPGPLMALETPELLYAAVAGMLGATVMLLVTGWYIAVGMIRVATINRQVVNVLALATIVLGVYSLNGRWFDVFVCVLMGIVGYFMLRYGYSVAAASLAVVLGPGFEQTLRRGLSLTDDSIVQFLSRPITLAIMLAAIAFLLVGIRRTLAFQRAERSGEGQAARDA